MVCVEAQRTTPTTHTHSVHADYSRLNPQHTHTQCDGGAVGLQAEVSAGYISTRTRGILGNKTSLNEVVRRLGALVCAT